MTNRCQPRSGPVHTARKDEGDRLEALPELKLLDALPSANLDRVTRLASQIFALPMAAISLTDGDRSWYKSRVGFSHDGIGRAEASCAEVVRAMDDVIITDLLADAQHASSHFAADGVRFYAGTPILTKDGHGIGALCVCGTVPRTASAEEMAALRDLAALVMAQIDPPFAASRTDRSSGLPNRHRLLEDLGKLALHHDGEARVMILVELALPEEIDTIVRALGGAGVDDLVRETADGLRDQPGSTQMPYHVGATQLCFLSPADVDQDAYAALLASRFAAMRAAAPTDAFPTPLLGVLSFTVGALPPLEVLRRALSAAQDARDGGNALGFYSATAGHARSRKLELVRDFARALENPDQLRLVYQPRVDLTSGRCVGGEALLRWRHPLLGDVAPSEFIPLIEHTSLMRATTAWVLDAALRQLGAWQRGGLDLVLSINVSAANLAELDFVENVRLHLRKHRVRPQMLEIEVTESAVMADPGKALACLEALTAAWISIAIDDFGAGYSSLAYLQRLPAQVVKIDQSFVRTLTACEDREYVLVSTMIGLSHKLGYRVVAEGIETAEALAALSAMGCDEGQGYFFAKPLEAEDVAGWARMRHATIAPPRRWPERVKFG